MSLSVSDRVNIPYLMHDTRLGQIKIYLTEAGVMHEANLSQINVIFFH